MTQIAAREGVTQTLRPPAYPAAPAMVYGIAEGTQLLEGTHALELTAQALLRRPTELRLSWQAQKKEFGQAVPS